jgi:hypothetical protein
MLCERCAGARGVAASAAAVERFAYCAVLLACDDERSDHDRLVADALSQGDNRVAGEALVGDDRDLFPRFWQQ